jgi:putative SOS response-associated peptidase YedK
MCAHYQSVNDRERMRQAFGVAMPVDGVSDVWPGYQSTFVRLAQPWSAQVAQRRQAPALEGLTGQFGLVPHWAKDTASARHTYNARSETVAEKPSFRDDWRLGRRCVIPAEAFYEPDWRSGRALPTRFVRADGAPLAIAGIWTGWRGPQGEVLRSFSMLTVNADQHPLMKHFHKPGEEKRMVVVLQADEQLDWLSASTDEARGFLRLVKADELLVQA